MVLLESPRPGARGRWAATVAVGSNVVKALSSGSSLDLGKGYLRAVMLGRNYSTRSLAKHKAQSMFSMLEHEHVYLPMPVGRLTVSTGQSQSFSVTTNVVTKAWKVVFSNEYIS